MLSVRKIKLIMFVLITIDCHNKGGATVIITPIQFLWIHVYPLDKENHNKGVELTLKISARHQKHMATFLRSL